MMMMSVITIMIIEQNNSNNVNITTSETIHCKIWVNILIGYVELT